MICPTTIAARSTHLARRLGIGLAALVAIGCQTTEKRESPPAPPPSPTPRDAAGDASAPGDAAADAAAPQRMHVTLPKSPATPPHRTRKPLSRKERDRLAAFEFTDFKHEVRSSERFTEIQHHTRTRPILDVTVRITPCDRSKQAKHPCLPMAVAPWRARLAELKQEIDPVLATRPDTRFQVDAIELAGVPAIFTYQLGWFFGTDDHGQPAGSYSDAYILYYNDGVNQIRVTAAYVDDAVGGVAQLLALAPPEDLETLALAFASFYVHEWK